MSLLERIKQLREAHGNISINRLEKEAGLSRGSMAKWDDHAPSYDKLQKVADYFSISVTELTEDPEKEKSPATNEGDKALEEFNLLFSQLSPEQQERELAYLRSLLTDANK